jgi:hypothetical protein
LTSLAIDGIDFEFDDRWLVTKWDESPWYRDKIERLKGEVDGKSESTKAVDVVGLHDETPYLIEVKDFRGFAIENKQRQLGELPLEIGLKARDTIAGIAGLVALGETAELPVRWLRAVREGPRPVHVIAWVAEDLARPGELAHKRASREHERLSVLKQRLAWLTRRVWVTNPLVSSTIPGVTATSIRGAGPARRR